MKTDKTTDAVADPLLEQGWRKVVAEVIDPRGSQRVTAYVNPNAAAKKSGKARGLLSSVSRNLSVAASTSVRIRIRYKVVKVRVRIRIPRFLMRLSPAGLFGSLSAPAPHEPTHKEEPSSNL